MPLVVDASVAVKFIAEEPGSGAALGVVLGPEPLIATDWMPLEVASALWRKVKANELVEAGAKQALAELRNFFPAVFTDTTAPASGLRSFLPPWSSRL